MKQEIAQLEKLIENSEAKIFTDWEIMEALSTMSDSAAEKWGDMCSDMPLSATKAILETANNFLEAYDSDFKAVEVDTKMNDDEFIWTFAKKAQKQLTQAQLSYMKEMTAAKGDIDHNCDGPMTPFVAISRAITLASTHSYDAEVLANALDQILEEHGWLTDQTPTTGTYQS
jgi:hypothetical protein